MKAKLLILKLFLCKFSGEDMEIIKLQVDRKIINSFSTIGFLVIMIFLGCFIGAYKFADIAFGSNNFIDFIIASFWSLICFIIYVFLLYTITPALLPSRHKRKGAIQIVSGIESEDYKKMRFTFGGFLSVAYKYIYILIISVVVSQPINILLFSSENLSNGQLIRYIQNINSMPISWIFSALAFFTFLIPIILKYRIRRVTDFYHSKHSIEKKIVLDDYDEFKPLYSTLINRSISISNERLTKKISPLIDKLKEIKSPLASSLEKKLKIAIDNSLNVTKYEHWQDAPFNIQKIEKESYSDEEGDLLNEIYSN
jgi:hypothetical protein